MYLYVSTCLSIIDDLILLPLKLITPLFSTFIYVPLYIYILSNMLSISSI